jgi:20S proteasome alpha/beta subunit
MTTIAASAAEGVMVSDSKCTTGPTWFPTTKVFRIGDELVGCAGTVKHWQDFLKWYRGGKRGTRPKGGEYSALILRKDGVYSFDSDGCEMRIERGFHAAGSGEHAAIAVMLAGHTVKEAVEIACQVDPGSGGDVKVYRLTDKP